MAFLGRISSGNAEIEPLVFAEKLFSLCLARLVSECRKTSVAYQMMTADEMVAKFGVEKKVLHGC